MEMWRAEVQEEQRPKVLEFRIVAIVFLVHLAFFAGLWVFDKLTGLFDKPEEIIPIDLTVVVVENLDGNPDEPPPLKKPEPPPPPPPKPKPKPKPKEPEKPKELEKIVTNIVEKVEKKPEKKEQPPEPKKTAKELREEKLKRMREKATKTNRKVETPKPSQPQPNGRTDKKTLSDAEIQKLLNAGYRPGSSTNLAASEEQLCYSLIKQAFEEKWDKPAWTDTLKPMVIRVWFTAGGRIANFKLEQSSGDPKADATIKSAASRVGMVRGLTAGFIEKHGRSGVPVRFKVTPQ